VPTPFSIVAATSCDPGVVPGAEFPPPISVPSPEATPLTLHVPILEYHRIVPLADAGKSLPGLTMPPEIFDAQMAALNKAGWHTITLATLADDLSAGVTPPAHSFVVTVDDGWWDSYGYAYPILEKYGYVATFFVIADRIGRPFFMGPSQIQALADAGNEVGDHSVSHNALTAASPKALTYEIDSGAATIAAITGRWPETLAYPLGKVDSQVIAAVAACKSLRMAVVEGDGAPETWADRFRVSRIQVGPYRTASDLLAQVQRVGR
jgi:peptidoglycan/xylan/chitin deacetylase (PgdA/CDA1 family)